MPTEIKYGALNMRALRYYPDASEAADIMKKVLQNKKANNYHKAGISKYTLYQKTSVEILANKQSLDQQLVSSQAKNNYVYKYFIHPYEPWLRHARSPEGHPDYLALTMLLLEDYKTVYDNGPKDHNGSVLHASRMEGLFQSIGQQNISYLLDEIFGDIDLYQDNNEVMLLSFKSPLSQNALDIYSYRLTGKKQISGRQCYEIAFFCENMKENTFAGSLYISDDGQYSLIEARFTLNNPANMNFLKNILITHTYTAMNNRMIPFKKEFSVQMGDEMKGSLVVGRTIIFQNFDFSKQEKSESSINNHDKDYASRDDSYWESIRPIELAPSQKQINKLVETASSTNSFRNFQNAVLILLNNHATIGGGLNGTVEIGPLTQFISYNQMEGMRLKVGGNTTVHLIDKLQLGGYVVYGTSDKRVKYRTNLIYSLHPRNQYIWEYPKNLISFTYVNDMNIPGQDLLTTNRDNFIYSFSHSAINNMSLQKIGLLTYENELPHQLSYKIGGQYKYDEPQGVVRYMKTEGNDTTAVRDIISSEVQLSLRFSPGEKFIQSRDKRIFIRRGDVELNLNHRIGIKGLLGSDYKYQISEFNGYKKFSLGNDGTMDLRLTAGKIWNRVPFPLLFIPAGNQSYIFQPEGYNCMNFYEFTTDNYIAGNLDFIINWSIIKLFNKKNKIKTSIGTRVLYGPLSDNNNPALHPELFIFNQGVNPLGNTPYVEANIGLANIFKILRVEYDRRLTYLTNNDETGGHKVFKGSLLVTGSFSF